MRRAIAFSAALWLAACGGTATPGDPGPGDVAGDVGDATGDVGLACRTVSDCAAMDPGPCGRLACSGAGVCEVRPDEGREGAACEPSDRCAVGGATCKSGACVPVERKVCPDRACLAGRCDEASGECRYESLADGQACETDGNPCTTDQCVGGACRAGPNECPCGADDDCPAPGSRCAPALRCDPGLDRCVSDTGPNPCPPPADPCRVATCDEAAATCVEQALADGVECEAESPCNGQGTCRDGACQRAPKCGDGDPCTEDRCEAATGACSYPPDDGAACEDGDPCSVDDRCKTGTCQAGAAKSCDDGNPCTVDACVPGTGCTWTAVDPATGCDDGDACTTGDVCGVGADCTGTSLDCDDGNACTSEGCDPGTGACTTQLLQDVPCEDETVCTVGDACQAGTCVPGPWTPECCEDGADCDDGDACTAERCLGNTCFWDGEPEDRCGPATEACRPSWCGAGTGLCEALDLRMPRRLLAWDLRTGGAAAGFRWAGAPGVRNAAGILGAGAQGSAVRLPGRRVPAGVVVMVLDLGTTGCGRVNVRVTGGTGFATDCRSVDGRNRQAVAWASAGGLLDVEVRVEKDATVASLDLYLWAQDDCVPLGPVLVAEGEGYSDLELCSNREGLMGVARRETVLGTFPYRLDQGLGPFGVLSTDPLAIQPGQFTNSLAAVGDSGFLLGFGGTREEVVTATLDVDGLVVKQSVLPTTVLSVNDWRFEPSLAGAGGTTPWIAWSLSREGSTDREIGIARGSILDGTPTFDATGTLLNVDTVGVQRRPRLATVGEGGVAAWISEQAGPQNRVMLRRLDGTGTPAGDEMPVDAGAEVLRDLAMAPVGGDKVAWVAERSPGVFRAGIRSSADLSNIADVAFAPSTNVWRYHPDLVSFDDAAVLVSVLDDEVKPRVRHALLHGNGVLGPEIPISPKVEIGSASPAAARLDPYWLAVSWVNIQPAQQLGIYLALTAPACTQGAVDCSVPAVPRVCVGFGETGYVPLPGASAWCP